MRIALIVPYSVGPMRGNISTVDRIARQLALAGAEVLVLAADACTEAEMADRLVPFAPDLLHGFHAYYCGMLCRRLAGQFGCPYVITITGSDIHEPQLRDHPDTREGLAGAAGVVCFHGAEAELLKVMCSAQNLSVTVIPQGAEELPCMGTIDTGADLEQFVLFLPAALRPVKQVEFPLRELAPLQELLPHMSLVLAGGEVDREYGETVRGLLAGAPFARWLGEVPRELMGALYARADVVLNCSRSESMPNSLLEAMALGRPVLAADIDGNRSLIEDSRTGWLYRDGAGFRERVLQLAGNAPLRERIGRQGQALVRERFSPAEEARRYLRLYGSLC